MNKLEYVFAHSDIGQREENQDSFVVLNRDDETELLVLVADGMGGHEGGQKAANCVIEVAQDMWTALESIEDPEAFLQKLVDTCHENVKQLGAEMKASPQTTLSAMYVCMGTGVCVVAQVGDSRVIQFSQRGFEQRTIDHSLAQLHAIQGKISEQEIANHPDQNKLYSSIGSSETPIVDIDTWPLIAGNMIVCSDGFWEFFDNQSMHEVISTINSQQALKQLITDKLTGLDNHDNVTVVLLGFSDGVTKGNVKPNNTSTSQMAILVIGILLMVGAIGVFFTEENNTKIATQNPVNEPAPPSTGEFPSAQNLPNAEPLTKPSSGRENKEIVGTEQGTSGNSEDLDSGGEIVTQRHEVKIPVKDEAEAMSKVEQLLKSKGELGQGDILKSALKQKKLGGASVLKLQQFHKGLPVYGAETIAIVKDGVLTSIHGKTLKDIQVNTQPGVSFAEALLALEEALQTKLYQVGKETLVIYQYEGRYLLAWLVNVEFENNDAKSMIIEASTAELLANFTLLTMEE